jgi:hypothetical protein
MPYRNIRTHSLRCTCMHVYVCVCMSCVLYTQLRSFYARHMYTCLYTCQCVRMYTHKDLYASIHTCMHACIHTCIHTYKHVNSWCWQPTSCGGYLYAYIHTYRYTYIHTGIHTYRYTYIHTYIHVLCDIMRWVCTSK